MGLKPDAPMFRTRYITATGQVLETDFVASSSGVLLRPGDPRDKVDTVIMRLEPETVTDSAINAAQHLLTQEGFDEKKLRNRPAFIERMDGSHLSMKPLRAGWLWAYYFHGFLGGITKTRAESDRLTGLREKNAARGLPDLGYHNGRRFIKR